MKARSLEDAIGQVLEECPAHEHEADDPGWEWIVRTEEHEFGYVLFYAPRGMMESEDVNYFVDGNAPYIYERVTGRLLVTGTAQSIETYLDNYRKTGDPHRELGRTVAICGWHEGANEVAAMKLLRKHSAITLADAKQCVDNCLAGDDSVVVASSIEDAVSMVDGLVRLGFEAERRPDEDI